MSTETCPFLSKILEFVLLQEIRCFSCVLPVITVTACLAGTTAGQRGPGLVLCTLTEPQLERAARPTAYPAPPVRTVTAQVWHDAPPVCLKLYPKPSTASSIL